MPGLDNPVAGRTEWMQVCPYFSMSREQKMRDVLFKRRKDLEKAEKKHDRRLEAHHHGYGHMEIPR
jgi:hypothetical protein